MQKPTIVTRDAMRVIGLGTVMMPGQERAVIELWPRFMDVKGIIATSLPNVSYGLFFEAHPKVTKTHPEHMTYMAACEVDPDATVPPGMIELTVPAGRYAKFLHHGPISKIQMTFRDLWGQWMPASGLETQMGVGIERYDERFKGESESTVVEILIPVK